MVAIDHASAPTRVGHAGNAPAPAREETAVEQTRGFLRRTYGEIDLTCNKLRERVEHLRFIFNGPWPEEPTSKDVTPANNPDQWSIGELQERIAKRMAEMSMVMEELRKFVP
jgi:hypothetical protein